LDNLSHGVCVEDNYLISITYMEFVVKL
jgi:hypothetical protein